MTILLLLFVCSGLLLAALSIPLMLRKIPPNPLYGFRISKTLNNPDVWYDANAFAATRLLIFSLVLVAAAVVIFLLPGVDEQFYSWSVLAIVVAGMAVVVFQSVRYLSRI
jgi:uncharacterized membrane protein